MSNIYYDFVRTLHSRFSARGSLDNDWTFSILDPGISLGFSDHNYCSTFLSNSHSSFVFRGILYSVNFVTGN